MVYQTPDTMNSVANELWAVINKAGLNPTDTVALLSGMIFRVTENLREGHDNAG